MPPLSAKSERKMAKMLANPFSYAKRREFIKHLRHYVVAAVLVLAICASLLFLPSTPTWASNGQSGALDGYVSVYEREFLNLIWWNAILVISLRKIAGSRLRWI